MNYKKYSQHICLQVLLKYNFEVMSFDVMLINHLGKK